MCESCQALRINGILCHESGCPDAWKDKKVVCKWCGTEFTPEEKGQQFCSDSCYCAYNGIPEDEEMEEEE